MIKEAMEYCVALLRDVDNASWTHLPERDQYVLKTGGKYAIRAKPNYRAHEVDSLPDFVAAVQRWGNNPSVWHDKNSVVGILDDAGRRDSVVFHLRETSTFKKLDTLQTGYQEPPKLTNQLRVLFLDYIDPDVLRRIANTKWDRTEARVTETTDPKESIGQSVKREVRSRIDVPDIIEVRVPVYANHESDPAKVRLFIESDLDTGKVRAFSLDDDIDSAYSVVQSEIGGVLVSELEEQAPDGKPVVFSGRHTDSFDGDD